MPNSRQKLADSPALVAEPRPTLRLGGDGRMRCAWAGAGADETYSNYHDREWGVALHGDRALFEKLSLEGFQAGLSWITILRRREAFRLAFNNFELDSVAKIDEVGVEALLLNAAIIRNRAKIVATISNAAIVRELVRHEPGAFDRLIWGFAPPGVRPRPSSAEIPTLTPESTALSAALRALGLRFVGPTSVYAMMQSIGMVDDHYLGCWRAG